MKRQVFNQAWSPFPEDDSGGCVQKVGDAGGGQYRLNMANAYETMTHTLIDNIVQERFGSKAARIFR